ncbi:MAG: hypothetical protein ACJ72C_02220 [Nitrososphaeraceae archaeon]
MDAILARGSEQFTKKKRQGKRRCHSILSDQLLAISTRLQELELKQQTTMLTS